MIIPCKEIARVLEQQLKQQVQSLLDKNTKPKLVTVLLGNAPEQLSFVRIKRRVAEQLGVEFEFAHFDTAPPFSEFLDFIEKKVQEPETSGIIIQHPLPQGYDQEQLYKQIPLEKEIEGHKPTSSFQFPLSLAVLTGLKYVLLVGAGRGLPVHNAIIDFQQDKPFFQKHLQDKNIVIAGRGPTGGAPIAKALDDIGLTYEIIHSQTAEPDAILKKADIVIAATGKKVVRTDNIKKGVILLNVGLRKENDKLKGDYDEEEVKEKAAYYTETPGGLGPLDVLYLYKNLLETYQLKD